MGRGHLAGGAALLAQGGGAPLCSRGSHVWVGWLWGAGAAGLTVRPSQLCGLGQRLPLGAHTLFSVKWGDDTCSLVGVKVNPSRARPSVLAWEQGGVVAWGPSEPQCLHLPSGERSFLLWCWDMGKIARQRPVAPGRWGVLSAGLGSVERI